MRVSSSSGLATQEQRPFAQWTGPLAVFGHGVLELAGQRRCELGLMDGVDAGHRLPGPPRAGYDLVARGRELGSEALHRERNVGLRRWSGCDLGGVGEQTASHVRVA